VTGPHFSDLLLFVQSATPPESDFNETESDT